MTSSPAAEAGVEARPELATLGFLAELSRALAVSLDLERTLSETVHRVVEFMRVEAASLFLLDPAAREPTLECSICAGPVKMCGTRVPVGVGVVGRTVAENAVQVVADATRDARVWRAVDEATGFVTRSLVSAPLATAGGPIGALEVINRRDGRPFSREDAELLALIAAPAALAINSARLAADLLEQQRLKREFILARRLQRSLLPRRRRGAFPIRAVNRPAHEISGDFYDYFDLDDGRLGFVVGDVSGKGMDAALLMVRAASLLRWIGKEGVAPADWLARANAELCESTQEGRFVCALVGYSDRAARRLRFAGAGFPPPLYVHRNEHREFRSGGPPLGIVADAAFEETELTLDGGSLYVFSDGATDVRDADGRPIGSEGLRRLIERHAGVAPEPRLRALLAELRRLHFVDDTTLLLIEAPVRDAPALLLAQRIAAVPATLGELRAAVRAVLDAQQVAPRLRERLVLAVDEACANIIRHGYGSEASGDIELRLLREGDELRFELRDDAPCADAAGLQPRPLGECRPGGLGLALIDAVADAWHIEPRAGGHGNLLILRKHIGPEEKSA